MAILFGSSFFGCSGAGSSPNKKVPLQATAVNQHDEEKSARDPGEIPLDDLSRSTEALALPEQESDSVRQNTSYTQDTSVDTLGSTNFVRASAWDCRVASKCGLEREFICGGICQSR